MNICYETWGGCTVTYKKLSERQYQITVPKELANQLVGCEGSAIYIWAQLEDPTGWAGIEESFQNTVNIYTGKEKNGGSLPGADNQTQSRQQEQYRVR